MEELIYLLQSIRPLSPELEAHLRSITHKYVFLKGEYLLHAGEVGKQILYISQGLVRSYRIIYEKEVSKWFMKERDICISVASFFKQKLQYTQTYALLMNLSDGGTRIPIGTERIYQKKAASFQQLSWQVNKKINTNNKHFSQL